VCLTAIRRTSWSSPCPPALLYRTCDTATAFAGCLLRSTSKACRGRRRKEEEEEEGSNMERMVWTTVSVLDHFLVSFYCLHLYFGEGNSQDLNGCSDIRRTWKKFWDLYWRSFCVKWFLNQSELPWESHYYHVVCYPACSTDLFASLVYLVLCYLLSRLQICLGLHLEFQALLPVFELTGCLETNSHRFRFCSRRGTRVSWPRQWRSLIFRKGKFRVTQVATVCNLLEGSGFIVNPKPVEIAT
jgi:hypothetical protein